jgi:large subunit ribosomal protein L1
MDEKSPLEAVQEVLKGSPERGFKETIEVSFNLKDLDLTLPKNRVEDEVTLPKGRGRPVKVGVFGSPELVTKIKGTADLTVLPDQMDTYFKDKHASRKQVDAIDFFLAEAPYMPTIGKRLGTVLGPRGKMPKPIPPGTDPTPTIQSLKRTVRVRNKGKKTFHVPVGTRDMSPEDLAQNLQAVLDRVVGKLERGRNNIGSVYLKTTMGKSVRIW